MRRLAPSSFQTPSPLVPFTRSMYRPGGSVVNMTNRLVPSVVPIAVQPLELVGVPVLLGGGEIQGGELERHHLVTVGELDAVRVGDGAARSVRPSPVGPTGTSRPEISKSVKTIGGL